MKTLPGAILVVDDDRDVLDVVNLTKSSDERKIIAEGFREEAR